MKLQADARSRRGVQQLAPGSQDYLDLGGAARDGESGGSRAGEKWRRRSSRDAQARQSATLLEEIQEVIAAVAKAKGFDYVVGSDAGPDPDADELAGDHRLETLGPLCESSQRHHRGGHPRIESAIRGRRGQGGSVAGSPAHFTPSPSRRRSGFPGSVLRVR